jgi:hypothetical protein
MPSVRSSLNFHFYSSYGRRAETGLGGPFSQDQQLFLAPASGKPFRFSIVLLDEVRRADQDRRPTSSADAAGRQIRL